MIKVKIARRNGSICGFEVKGHSGYSESGSDIVCSAVSVLVINTINSIEEYTEEQVICNEGEGSIKAAFPDTENGRGTADARLLLNTMAKGLYGIQENYGSFIEIDDCEV